VQSEVEQALARVLRVDAALTVAGRTDSGVHALGQVAHLDVPEAVWSGLGATLLRRLAGVLPDDVRVTAVGPAPLSFHARYGALWRRYAYRVTDARYGAMPLRRTDTLAWPRDLDVARMARASALLLGERDFAAYCRRRERATSVRVLQRFAWSREADGVLTATVQADAFCHQMVRSLVGAVLAVGDGRQDESWPVSLLARTVRADRVIVAPAHALTLLAVGYPAEDDLAARSARTQGRRSPAY
jgi:tRNA pseudouridine38-40 synthase